MAIEYKNFAFSSDACSFVDEEFWEQAFQSHGALPDVIGTGDGFVRVLSDSLHIALNLPMGWHGVDDGADGMFFATPNLKTFVRIFYLADTEPLADPAGDEPLPGGALLDEYKDFEYGGSRKSGIRARLPHPDNPRFQLVIMFMCPVEEASQYNGFMQLLLRDLDIDWSVIGSGTSDQTSTLTSEFAAEYKKFAFSSDASSFTPEESREFWAQQSIPQNQAALPRLIGVGDGFVRVHNVSIMTSLNVPMGWYGNQTTLSMLFTTPDQHTIVELDVEQPRGGSGYFSDLEGTEMTGIVFSQLPERTELVELKDFLFANGHRRAVTRAFVYHPRDENARCQIVITLHCPVQEAEHYTGFVRLLLTGLEINWDHLGSSAVQRQLHQTEAFGRLNEFRDIVLQSLIVQDRDAVNKMLGSNLLLDENKGVIDQILNYFSNCRDVTLPEVSLPRYDPEGNLEVIYVQTMIEKGGQQRSFAMFLIEENRGPGISWFMADVSFENGRLVRS